MEGECWTIGGVRVEQRVGFNGGRKKGYRAASRDRRRTKTTVIDLVVGAAGVRGWVAVGGGMGFEWVVVVVVVVGGGERMGMGVEDGV